MVRRGVDDRKLRIRTPYVCMLCTSSLGCIVYRITLYTLHYLLTTQTLVERRTTHEALGHVLVEC